MIPVRRSGCHKDVRISVKSENRRVRISARAEDTRKEVRIPQGCEDPCEA